MLMKGQESSSVRIIESPDDFEEARLEATGYIFHGIIPDPEAKRPGRAGSNLLHFARCAKLDKVGEAEHKLWYRTIHGAKEHLDEAVGQARWKWCKLCEREVTQRLINER